MLLGLGEGIERVNAMIDKPEVPIPAVPSAAHAELLADIDTFTSWINAQGQDRLARQFKYGSETDLPSMLACMSMHIT